MRYVLAAAVLALALFATADSTSSQEQFFQPCAKVELENTSPGAAAGITRTLGIGLGDDCQDDLDEDENMYMFSSIVQFTPPAWEIVDVPVGFVVGSASWSGTFGLLNNGCNTSIRVDFTYYDATTDVNGPRIDPLPPGTADRMKPLGEGIPPAGAMAWPSYLNELYPNADWSLLRARYLGVAKIAQAGNPTVILNILVFEPGARVTDPENFDPIQGYPSVYVLQDPTAPAGAADLINDFCSPLLMQETLTDAVLKNPQPGQYPFTAYTLSQRDADNDGFENSLDTCNSTPNQGNPRLNPDPGDPDRDGLDAACDPDPAAGKGTCAMNLGNTDEDGDLWCNRSDNCPLVANGDQADGDDDAIGDACDGEPGIANGAQIPRCVITVATVGGGGAQTHDPLQYRPCNPTTRCLCDFPRPVPTPTAHATTTPAASRTPAAFPATGRQGGGAAPETTLALMAILAATGVTAFALVRRRFRSGL